MQLKVDPLVFSNFNLVLALMLAIRMVFSVFFACIFAVFLIDLLTFGEVSKLGLWSK